MKLEKTKHPYYCSSSNYYTNDYPLKYDTVSEFLDEFDDDTDIDMNYCFRFDIEEKEDEKGLCASFFLILQRKGIFMPCICENYDPDTESDRLNKYLESHNNYHKELWKEIV